ncbi:DapH/DapD/GlmU-related protein [Roseicella frigidaeris]|uniref:Acetyltransferase n=1 Tax=Roseicella frigidaeris TaxID=2230885 RepID=A0A327M6H3_9PROT|nr:DapH/DapD/GlmU-related protein [Roseicella frigidaeris]RAI57966.1 acetyltransferase [Roseicella frigidaeris]
MTAALLFGIGSPLVVDVEESLHRAGLRVAAGIHNCGGRHWLPEGIAVLAPEALSGALLDLPYLVPLFTPRHRRLAARQAASLGLRHPLSLIDPSIAAPRRLEIGPGCYLNAGISLGSNSTLGAFVLVNRGASIGHHARLGAFVSIGPGAVLAGGVTIGEGSMVCAGATILPGVTIGEDAVVAAGAVVTRDLPDGHLAAGNPARHIRHDNGLKAG